MVKLTRMLPIPSVHAPCRWHCRYRCAVDNARLQRPRSWHSSVLCIVAPASQHRQPPHTGCHDNKTPIIRNRKPRPIETGSFGQTGTELARSTGTDFVPEYSRESLGASSFHGQRCRSKLAPTRHSCPLRMFHGARQFGFVLSRANMPPRASRYVLLRPGSPSHVKVQFVG
jgi:hypothetical protein